MSQMRAVLITVGFVAAAISVVGCAERPQVDQLADAIASAAANDATVDVSADEARCIADQLLNSGLSDTTLEGLAENFDSPEVLADEIDDVEPTVAAAALHCVTGG